MKKIFCTYLLLLACCWLTAYAADPALVSGSAADQTSVAKQAPEDKGVTTDVKPSDPEYIAEQQKLAQEKEQALKDPEAGRPEVIVPYVPKAVLAVGDNCADPIVVNLPADLPYFNSNTTCNRVNDYSETCLGYYDGGEDIIYRLEVSSEVTVSIIMNPNGSTWTGMALDDACPLDPTTCLAKSTHTGSQPDSIVAYPLVPGTYYLMIDTWPSPTCIPSFNLAITVYNPNPPGRCCYGDPVSPTCIDNTQSECAGLEGTWDPSKNCAQNPCPSTVGNDCNLPIVVNLPAALPYSDLGQTTCGRVNDYSNTCLGYYDGGEDIIYRLDVSEEVTVSIVMNPLGTTYTGLALDDACPLDASTCLAMQSHSGSQPDSIVGYTLAPGSYYLMVDTWPSPTCIPSFNLSITQTTPPIGRCCYGDPYAPTCVDNLQSECAALQGSWDRTKNCAQNPCPALPLNDSCQSAITVAIPSSTAGTTVGATIDAFPTCGGYSITAPGVWYKVVGNGDSLSASLCNANSNWDTRLFVYCNTCTQPLCVDADDDDCTTPGLASVVNWRSNLGDEYLILVTGYSSNVGPFQLDIINNGPYTSPPFSCVYYPPPPNDSCQNVTPVALVPGSPLTFTGTVLGATSSGDCPSFSLYPNVWEAFTTSECMDITIDFCGTSPRFGNAWLNMALGCPCTGTTVAGTWDSTSCGGTDHNITVRWTHVAAGTYYYPVMLDPAHGDNGPYTLHVSGVACPPPLPGEDCTVPIVINVPGQLPYTNVNTTCDKYNDYSNTCLGLYDGGPDVLYKLVVTQQTMIDVVLDPDSTYSGIALSDSCPPRVVTCLATSTRSDSSIHGFSHIVLVPGEYYIMVDNWPAPRCIDYTLNISLTPPPPPGDSCSNALVVNLPADLPYTNVNTTCDKWNDYSNTCLGTYDGGRDAIYQLNVTAPTAVDIILVPDSTYSGIALSDSCPPRVVTCLGTSTSYPVSTHGIYNVTLPVGTYYVMVDNYPGPRCIDYTLNITPPCNITYPPVTIPEGEPTCYDEYVDATNGGCDVTPNVFGTITCGAPPIAATSGTFKVGGVKTRDNDWYQFTLPDTFDLVLEAMTEFKANVYIYRGQCGSLTTVASAVAMPCVLTTLNPILQPAGNYYVKVTPYADSGVTCGAEYYVSLQCNEPPWAVNDLCANASPIGDVVNQPWDTRYAHHDGPGTCIGTTAPNIWYDYTASCNGQVTVSLCGTNWDTKLGIYDGLTCAPLGTQIDCDDDDCDLPTGMASISTFNATVGHHYLIEVGGYSSNSGQGVISIGCAYPTFGVNPTSLSGEAPEGSADAETLTVTNSGTGTMIYTVSTSQGPVVTWSGQNPDQVWTGTTPEPGTRPASITRDGSTAEALRQRKAEERERAGETAGKDANADNQAMYEAILAGVRQYTPGGDIPIILSDLAETEPNGICSWANAMTCGDRIYCGHLTASTDTSDFFVFTLDNTYSYWAVTCSTYAPTECPPGVSDTKLYVYNSDCSVLLAYDDDSGPSLYSRITLANLDPGTYNIKVGPYTPTGYTGYYHMVLGCSEGVAPPANDDCANAIALTGPYPISTSGSCFAARDDCPALLDPGFAAVWYSFPLPYAYNDVSAEICGDGINLYNVGIILMNDCACDDYRSTSDYTWPICANTYQGILLNWHNVRGPGTMYIPVLAQNSSYVGIPFLLTLDLTEVFPCVVTCPPDTVPEAEACGANTNGGCNSTPPVFEPVTPGTTVCGTAWSDGSTRDTDWYLLSVANPTLVTIIAEAEFPLRMLLYKPGTPVECTGYTNLASVAAPPCSTVAISYGVPAGNYWIILVPSDWYDMPCDESGDYFSHYYFSVATQPWWLSTDIRGDTLLPGQSGPVAVRMDAAELAEGEYTGNVIFSTNEVGLVVHEIPVSFTVTAGGCAYIPGDVNGSGSFDGIDVGMAVNFFKGASLPPGAVRCPPCSTLGLNMLYPEGDVNATCTFNGIDIGYMVNHFKFWGPPRYDYPTLYCLQCPPARAVAPSPGETPAVQPILKSKGEVIKGESQQ